MAGFLGEAESKKFKPCDATVRLRLLQTICTSNGAEYLIFVPGIDGNGSPGSASVVKWLFGGSVGGDTLEPTVSGPLEDLEDIVVFVRHRGISVVCTHGQHKIIKGLMTKWTGVNEFLLPRSDESNAETAELFKIESFVKLVRMAKGALGMPISATWLPHGSELPLGAVGTDPKNVVETWPLVQAYGLDQFKTGGFLTSKHEVRDIGEALDSLWAHVDAHALDVVSHEVSASLVCHWSATMRHISKLSASRQGTLSELTLGAPLITYYEFGRVRAEAHGASTLPGRGAFALFGPRTSDLTLSSDDAVLLDTAGHNGAPALHCVVQGEDPASGVRAVRTYIRTRANVSTQPANATRLVVLYGALVIAHRAVLRAVGGAPAGVGAKPYLRDPSRPRATRRLLDLARKTFAAALASQPAEVRRTLVPDEPDLRGLLALELDSFDLAGRSIPNASLTKSGDGTFPIRVVFFIRLSLGGVPSCETCHRDPGQYDLGTITIGDSIVPLPSDDFVPQAQPDSLRFTAGNGVWVLTGDIPVCNAWTVSNESDAEESIPYLENPATLGSVLGGVPDRTFRATLLLSGGAALPILREGSVCLRESGFTFLHPMFGQTEVIFNFECAESVRRLVGGNGPAADTMLELIDFELNAASLPPALRVVQLLQGCDRVALMVSSGSGVAILHEAISRGSSTPWANISTVQFDPADDASPFTFGLNELFPIHAAMRRASALDACRRFDMRLGRPAPADVYSNCAVHECETTNMSLPESGPVTIVTVVVGAVGSGKRALGRALEAFLREDITGGASDGSVAIIANDVYHGEKHDHARLVRLLRGAAERGARYIIVIGAGHATPVQIVRGVQTASTALLPIQIGSCVAVASAQLAYRYCNTEYEDSELLPNVLAQCRNGWVQHIILTSTDRAPDCATQSLHSRLSGWNPLAKITRTPFSGLDPNEPQLPLRPEMLRGIVSNRGFGMNAAAAARSGESYDDGTDDESESIESVFVHLWPPLRRPRFVKAMEVLTLRASSRTQAAKAQILAGINLAKDTENKRQDGDIEYSGLSGIRRAQQLAMLKMRAKEQAQAEVDARDVAALECPGGEIWEVRGFVRFVGDLDHVFQFVAAGGGVNLAVVESDVPGTLKLEKGFRATFSGINFDAIAIEKYLLNCRTPIPPRQTPRDLASLTLEEIQLIEKSHADDPLPSGFWFDGSGYVDHTGPSVILGQRLKRHPEFRRFALDWLQLENEKIKSHNQRVETLIKAQKRELTGPR